MTRDKRGTMRGRCTTEGCDCGEYGIPETGHACEYCGHLPPAHRKVDDATAPATTTASAPSVPIAPPKLSPAAAASIMAPSGTPSVSPFVMVASATATTPTPTSTPSPSKQPLSPVSAATSVPAAPASTTTSLYPDLSAELQQQPRATDGLPAVGTPASVNGWGPEIVGTVMEMVPGSTRETVEGIMRSKAVCVGDFDGLLGAVMASQSAPQPAAASSSSAAALSIASPPKEVPMDAETLRAIEEAMTPERDCILCLDVFPVTKMYTVNCPDAHRFCFECIGRYIEMCIKENKPIICPAPSKTCTHELEDEEVIQVMRNTGDTTLREEHVNKYKQQQLLRGIQSIPGIIACPTPGCPNWIVPFEATKRELCRCDACHAEFCSLCKRLPYHINCECDEVLLLTGKWIRWTMEGRAKYSRNKAKIAELKARQQSNAEMRQKYEDLLADERYKAENGRLCPSCKRVIIRESGCDSMVCGRDYHGGNVQDGCGARFNWSKAKKYKPAAYKEPKAKAVHIPEDVRQYLHEGIVCSRCRGEVRGIRVCCVHCADYNLCENCEVEGTEQHPKDHVFRVMMMPGHNEEEEVHDPDEEKKEKKHWWMVWRW